MGKELGLNNFSLDGFDPLGSVDIGESDISKIIEDSQKRDVLNILRSYTGFLDVFSESMQNSIDASEIKSRIFDKSFVPKIWITIDIKNNMLRFVDNGIGLSKEQLRFFVRPSISFKKNEGLRGHKGVGATFLAYGYTSFTVHTKQTDIQYAATLSGGRAWAESPTHNIPRPRFSDVDYSVPELFDSNSGTAVEIVIGGFRDERPNLSWLNIVDPEIWFKILRLRTPVGGVYLSTGGIKPEYNINVIDASGHIHSKSFQSNAAEFYYPHEFSVCNRNQDIDSIAKEVAKIGIPRSEIAQKLPANFRNLDCLWNIWDNASIVREGGVFVDDFSDDQITLLRQHDVKVYACFVRSRTIWETFQKDELAVRSQFRVIQGGMQLASDFMVQGDLVTIPLTTAQGYQSNAFIIVHFTNGNPDMGRKVFQPELKEVADILSRRVVGEIRKFQALLKPDTGAPYSNASKQLEDWRDDQKTWHKSNPLRLVLSGKDISLLSTPREEQDVIALFHQLVGMGFIQGLKFFSTGYNTRYDGLYKYSYESRHRFDAVSNFWGVDGRFAPGESGALVLEYKHSMDGLVRDFDKEEKSPQEINLLICWTIGNAYRKSFEIVPLLIGQEGGTRENYAATHAAFIGTGRATKAFEIISLSDVIGYLEDPDGTLARQATIYNDKG